MIVWEHLDYAFNDCDGGIRVCRQQSSPEPIWTATQVDDLDPPDVWCLIWRSDRAVRLRSVHTLRDFLCETFLANVSASITAIIEDTEKPKL